MGKVSKIGPESGLSVFVCVCLFVCLSALFVPCVTHTFSGFLGRVEGLGILGSFFRRWVTMSQAVYNFLLALLNIFCRLLASNFLSTRDGFLRERPLQPYSSRERRGGR